MNKILSFLLVFIALSQASAQDADSKKADEFFKNKDYYSAIPIYQNILKKDAANRSVLFRLASCYLGINNEENALLYYETLVSESDSISRSSFDLFAGYYLGKGRFKEAVDVLARAMAKFPSEVRFAEQILFAYEGAGDYASALQVLESAPLEKGNGWHRKKIGYLVSLKRYDEAEKLISDLEAQGKDSVFWSDVRASYYAGRGQLQEAEKIWDALFVKTGDTAYLRSASQAYLSASDRISAVRVVRRPLSVNGPDAWTQVANLMKDLALYPELIDLYLDREKANPGVFFDMELFNLYELTSRSQDAVIRYVAFLLRTRDLSYVRPRMQALAEKGFDRFITEKVQESLLSQKDENLKVCLEILLYDMDFLRGETTSATHHVLNVLKLNGSSDFLFSAVDQFVQKRWFGPAREILQEFLRISADVEVHVKASFKKADIEYLSGETKLALKTLDSIAQKYPGQYDEDALLKARGTLLLSLGSYSESHDAFIRIKKKSGSVQIGLGLCFFFQDRLPDAKLHLQLAEKDPETSAEALLLEAMIALYESDAGTASRILEVMARTKTADPFVHDGLGELFALRNIFVSSASNFTKIYAMGKRASLAGKHKEAAGYFESLAVKIDRYAYFFLYQAATAFEQSGDLPVALLTYSKVYDDPTAPLWFRSSSMEKAADVMDRTGNRKEAFELYRKIILTDTQYVRGKEVRLKYDLLKRILPP
jgi:tetratricopeptide (TPR) repeat protein